AALQAVGGDLRKVTPEMLGMAAATNQMSQAAQAATSSMRTTSTAATGLMQSMQRQAQTAFDASRANTAIASTATHAGGAMSGVVREFTVLGREAMVGRFSLIPGSMLVLANRMGVASAAVYGLVAAFAAAAIAGAALYEWIGKINAAKAGAEASAAFYNTDVSQVAIDKMVMKYRELDGVSTENAGKVVATYASMRGANETTIQALINQTQAYADATGSKLPQAAAEIKRAFEAPTEAGLRFLNNINASADAIKKFDAASGDTAVADKRRVMLEALAAATARVGETNSEVAKRQAQDAASAAMMTGGGFAVPGFDPLAAVAADRAKERQALSSQQADALANMTSVEKAKGSTKSTEPSWATKERAALDDILLKATANAKSMADLERSKAQATADFWDTASKQEGITQQQRLQAEAAANQARLTLTAMSVRTNVAGAKESLAAHLAELSAEQAGYRDDFAKWNEIEQR
ncbi:MAG: hypothetical protein KGL35_12275, partial [Bradyrhizobium sp.]|nr:hypothetical protein [Bradyrhizobium sp.]